MISKEDYITPKTGIRIWYKGAVDVDKLWKDMKKWFDRYKYDFWEKDHTLKDLDKGMELVSHWIAEREVNDYIKFVIEVKFLLERLRKVDNKMEGFHKITFFAYLNLDYRNKWQKNSLYKFLFHLYNNYIIKRKIEDDYEGRLYSELTELHNMFKNKLKD
jgi:hypothetical protein